MLINLKREIQSANGATLYQPSTECWEKMQEVNERAESPINKFIGRAFSLSIFFAFSFPCAKRQAGMASRRWRFSLDCLGARSALPPIILEHYLSEDYKDVGII
jgi:hypothetical protein